MCLLGTASGKPASMTDEKPTLVSPGLTGQVALCRPFPPSSRNEVTERPGWQPRGLPDLSNFHLIDGPHSSSLRPLGNLVKSQMSLLRAGT